jgi:hypothetical protein
MASLRHFHRLLVGVDGRVEERVLVEPAALNPMVAIAAGSVFVKGKNTGRTALQIIQAPLTLQWTAGAGAALTTVFHDETPTMISVLLAGLNAEFEAQIAQLWTDSVRRNKTVAALAGGAPAPFRHPVEVADRPLCVTALLPTLDQDSCLDLLDWHDHLAGAFFAT